MDCANVQELLSAYFDGELPPETLLSIDEHCADCETCAAELRAIRKMSVIAHRLKNPEPPTALWSRISGHLPTPAGAASPRTATRWLGRKAALAAGLIGVIAAGAALIWAQQRWADPHRQMAATFSEFVTQFESHPEDQSSLLIKRYRGVEMPVEQVAQKLSFRPVIADMTPPGCTLEGVYLMDMPCCKCIQAIFRRGDGGRLDILEHNEEQQVWFGSRPCIRASCAGKDVSVTQLKHSLAASWPVDGHYVTVVGARNLDEVVRLAEQMNRPAGVPE